MNQVNYAEIREMYKNIDTKYYDPYPIDWIKVFTPIEYMAWCDIRDYPMYMWPQYPIRKYFADFANIQKKIVIECDGKEWHDKERDDKRDADMIADGWTVYRLTGSECNKIVKREDYQYKQEYLHELYGTSTGLIRAIFNFNFKQIIDDENERALAYRALEKHTSGTLIRELMLKKSEAA